MHQAEGIDFWVVRKGEDAYKVAPEVADEISEHPNDGVCLFCGDGHKISAVIAFRWRVDAGVCAVKTCGTGGICVDCARHSDEKLAEMILHALPDRDARQHSVMEEMEAMGLLETVEIDPVTGEKRRQITAKGLAELEAQERDRSKH